MDMEKATQEFHVNRYRTNTISLESKICEQRLTYFRHILRADGLEKMLVKKEERKTCNELARRDQESYLK
ncbi:hypothetical protein LAZ67_4003655, partial [Cordylochernes scorpioides]